MIAFIKKHAAAIIGILVIITVSTVVLTFVIANNHNNVNTTSSEDSDNIQLLNEAFGFNFTDDQIYNIYTESDNLPSTEVAVKFRITAEQLKAVTNYTVREEYAPGDIRFFDRENISVDSIKKYFISWKEKVTEYADSSVEYHPYEVCWFIMNDGFSDNYDAAAWTYLPYKADIDAKE